MSRSFNQRALEYRQNSPNSSSSSSSNVADVQNLPGFGYGVPQSRHPFRLNGVPEQQPSNPYSLPLQGDPPKQASPRFYFPSQIDPSMQLAWARKAEAEAYHAARRAESLSRPRDLGALPTTSFEGGLPFPPPSMLPGKADSLKAFQSSSAGFSGVGSAFPASFRLSERPEVRPSAVQHQEQIQTTSGHPFQQMSTSPFVSAAQNLRNSAASLQFGSRPFPTESLSRAHAPDLSLSALAQLVAESAQMRDQLSAMLATASAFTRRPDDPRSIPSMPQPQHMFGARHDVQPPTSFGMVDVNITSDPFNPQMVTKYTPEERKARVEKFLQRKKNRKFGKKLHYPSRQKIAVVRPRVRGRFVKKGEVRDLSHASDDEKPSKK
mmetsp:Transcript_50423/g.129897  ORF Transcript_50423/g.129897 Transcript_50423/m.129897 type:complete len:379 (-) Transcript_50423:315-1451(-)